MSTTSPARHTPPRSTTGFNPLRPVEPIQIRAQDTLAHSDYLELRPLSCEFFAGVLTLRGTVGSFYMKQLAQETLRGLDGVRYIANEIRVSEN